MRRMTTLPAPVLLSLALMLLAPAFLTATEHVARDVAENAGLEEQKTLVVFLVRHAEKELNASRDPELSRAGRERSALLATLLRDAELDTIHSSDFIRTRDTAAPVSAAYQLEVELYDPRDLPALVRRINDAGGRHLVVGHSNTTPKVVELLGGEPGTEIDEAGEYDRLYVVTMIGEAESETVLVRYGFPFSPE